MKAIDADIEKIQNFLLSSTPFVYVNSNDVTRLERILLQLSTILHKDLYITYKGDGLFKRSYTKSGILDIPVIKLINKEYLADLISNAELPPISSAETDAMDLWLASHASGAKAAQEDEVAVVDIAQIIEGSIPEIFIPSLDIEKLFIPVAVPEKKISEKILESTMIYEEFLTRCRIKLISSSGETYLHPKLMTPGPAGLGSEIPDTRAKPDKDKQPVAFNICVSALKELGSKIGVEARSGEQEKHLMFECLEAFKEISGYEKNSIILLEGFKEDLDIQASGSYFKKSIRDLESTIRYIQDSKNQIFLIASMVTFPSSLQSWMSSYSLNYPDSYDISTLIISILTHIQETNHKLFDSLESSIIQLGQNNDSEDERFDNGIKVIVNSLRGLTESQIDESCWYSIKSIQKLDPKALKSKRDSIINQTAGLAVIESNVSIENLSGMNTFKTWLKQNSKNLLLSTEESEKELGGFVSKGILLIGLPGTGKSFIAKTLANYLNKEVEGVEVSLIRLDVASLRGQYVGQTEERTKEVLRVIDSFAPVVLWIDEIEKAFSGAGGDTSSEISVRMLGTFLTWMQERKAPVFIVATANDVSALRPEFKRKGRWDKIFYVPLPDEDASLSIFNNNFKKFGISLKDVVKNSKDGRQKLTALLNFAISGNLDGKPSKVMMSKGKPLTKNGEEVTRLLGYTGVELEQAVFTAVMSAKSSYPTNWKEKISVNDLYISLKGITPISRGMQENKVSTMAALMVDLEKQGDRSYSEKEEIDIKEEFNNKVKLGDIAPSKKIEDFLKNPFINWLK